MSKRFVRWHESKDVEAWMESMGFHFHKNFKTEALEWISSKFPTDSERGSWISDFKQERLGYGRPEYMFRKFKQQSCFDQEDLLDRLEKSITGVTKDELPKVLKEFIKSEIEDIEKTKIELDIKNCK